MIEIIINFLISPILHESVKTWPGGYNDWPPVWLVIVAVIVLEIRAEMKDDQSPNQ